MHKSLCGWGNEFVQAQKNLAITKNHYMKIYMRRKLKENK